MEGGKWTYKRVGEGTTMLGLAVKMWGGMYTDVFLRPEHTCDAVQRGDLVREKCTHVGKTWAVNIPNTAK